MSDQPTTDNFTMRQIRCGGIPPDEAVPYLLREIDAIRAERDDAIVCNHVARSSLTRCDEARSKALAERDAANRNASLLAAEVRRLSEKAMHSYAISNKPCRYCGLAPKPDRCAGVMECCISNTASAVLSRYPKDATP